MIITKIVQSPFEPFEKNVLWDDGKSLRVYDKGKWEVRGGSGGSQTNEVTNITYSELKSLRDVGNLVPGTKYKIIDYQTTVPENDKLRTSIKKDFDIIVTANSKTELSHDAKACKREIKDDGSFQLNIGDNLYTFVKNGKAVYKNDEYYDYVISKENLIQPSPIFELKFQHPENSSEIILTQVGKSFNTVFMDNTTGTIFSGNIIIGSNVEKINMFLEKDRELNVGENYPIYNEILNEYIGELLLLEISNVNNISNYHALSKTEVVNGDEVLLLESKNGELVSISKAEDYPDFEVRLANNQIRRLENKGITVIESMYGNSTFYILSEYIDGTEMYYCINVNDSSKDSSVYEFNPEYNEVGSHVGSVAYRYDEEKIPDIYVVFGSDISWDSPISQDKIQKFYSSGIEYIGGSYGGTIAFKYHSDALGITISVPNPEIGQYIYDENLNNIGYVIDIESSIAHPDIVVNIDGNLSEFEFNKSIFIPASGVFIFFEYKNQSETIYVDPSNIYLGGPVFSSDYSLSHIGEISDIKQKSKSVSTVIKNEDYFANCDLDSWKLKYDINNKTSQQTSFKITMNPGEEITFVKYDYTHTWWIDDVETEFDVYLPDYFHSLDEIFEEIPAICFKKGVSPKEGMNTCVGTTFIPCTKIISYGLGGAEFIDEIENYIVIDGLRHDFIRNDSIKFFDTDNQELVEIDNAYIYLYDEKESLFEYSMIITPDPINELTYNSDYIHIMYSPTGTMSDMWEFPGYINIPIQDVIDSQTELTEKGVIYNMIDEFGNECDYDFKNIWWLKEKTSNGLHSIVINGDYVPTFCGPDFKDVTITKSLNCDNVILKNSPWTVFFISESLKNVNIESVPFRVISENVSDMNISLEEYNNSITYTSKLGFDINYECFSSNSPVNVLRPNSVIHYSERCIEPSIALVCTSKNKKLVQNTTIYVPVIKGGWINIYDYSVTNSWSGIQLKPGYRNWITITNRDVSNFTAIQPLEYMYVEFDVLDNASLRFLNQDFESYFFEDNNNRLEIDGKRLKTTNCLRSDLSSDQHHHMIIDAGNSMDRLSQTKSFKNCKALTNVSIYSNLIGSEWFSDCSNLIDVSIHNCIEIRTNAFYNCYSLKNISIPEGVTLIGEGAFWNCKGLTSITIPGSVTEISQNAFRNCIALKSITIPDGVTSIGYFAFYDCSSLESIAIPDNITSILESTFYNCKSLASVTIGSGVTSIGDYAFSICHSLTSITIPDSVTSIGKLAFSGCTSLKSITIPDSVTSIGYKAFEGCRGELILNRSYSGLYGGQFTKLVIGDSVTEIWNAAFEDCTSLTSVTIGNGVTSIGMVAFSDCTSLKEVYCKPTTPPRGDNSMFSNNASGRKIYVPMESVDAYKAAEGWSAYADDIVGYDFV